MQADTTPPHIMCVRALYPHPVLPGKERDAESGNDYFGARYYGSKMGRFMSPDWSSKVSPVPYANLADPQTLNLYEYVRNNPLSLVDDDGHNWFGDFAQGLADSTYRPIVHVVEHPIATAQGIGSAVAHPIVTGEAIGHAVAGTVVAAAHGDGRAIGQIVGTAGTAVAGDAIARGVGGAAEVGSFVGESTSVSTTELYRAVDATELQSIQSTGSFLPSPNGTEYKGFFNTPEAAQLRL
jgi:RHS repeat-associated protein